MENVFGHNFILFTDKNRYIYKYICEQCKIIVFETDGNIYISNAWLGEKFQGNPNVILNITCDETLIKSILE